MRQKRDHQLEQEREAKQKAYAAQLAELQSEIEHEKRRIKGESDDQERKNVLEQHRKDLEKLRNTKGVVKRQSERKQSPDRTHVPQDQGNQDNNPSRGSSPNRDNNDPSVKSSWDQSEARDDWEYQKTWEGQDNEALDSLMGMIGVYRIAPVAFFFSF